MVQEKEAPAGCTIIAVVISLVCSHSQVEPKGTKSSIRVKVRLHKVVTNNNNHNHNNHGRSGPSMDKYRYMDEECLRPVAREDLDLAKVPVTTCSTLHALGTWTG